jgi:hypothetical protein
MEARISTRGYKQDERAKETTAQAELIAVQAMRHATSAMT